LDDKQLKRLVWRHGFEGASKKIRDEYGIGITKQTVRNEIQRRGIQARSHDVKSGLYFEILVDTALSYLDIEGEHRGRQIGAGIDVYFEYEDRRGGIECKNQDWKDKKVDKRTIEDRIVDRFKEDYDIKLVIWAKAVEYTKKARQILEENGIKTVCLGNEVLKRNNWNRMLQKAILKLGEALNAPKHIILKALRRAKQEEGEEQKYFDLVDVMVDNGHVTVCKIDDNFEDVDRESGGGGGKGVSRLLYSIEDIICKGYKKVSKLVSGVRYIRRKNKNGGEIMGKIDSKELSRKLDLLNEALDEHIKTFKQLTQALRDVEFVAKEMAGIVKMMIPAAEVQKEERVEVKKENKNVISDILRKKMTLGELEELGYIR